MENKKLSFQTIFTDGISIGLKNATSLLGALVLYVLTIWVPYINVGTTIALSAIPVELSKGRIISPTFIFDGKYRKFMGEYFNLIGLKMMALIPAYLFLYVPGLIISISWSLALYLMLDKEVSPSDSLIMSNKATYGHKWTLFLVGLVIVLAFMIIGNIFGQIASGTLLVILLLILLVATMAIALGCQAVIYRDLVNDEEEVQSTL